MLRQAGIALLLLGIAAWPHAQETRGAAQQGEPTLTHRPAPKPPSAVIPEGKITLDVVVNDSAGRPVTGLEPWEFKILDNGQPRKVMSFHSYDGAQVKPDPPVELILVVDTVNLLFQQLSFARGQIDEFLRQNGGQLKHPVTLVLFTEKGVQIQSRPSTDGNAVASVLDGIQGTVRVFNQAMGFDGQLERFQVSERAMENIAQNEARKPGRKLLIWVGWGWPIMNRPSTYSSSTQQRRLFDSIVAMSTALREARMTVYSVAPAGVYGPNPMQYQAYLKGVKRYQEADFGNLALRVLVMQTGGKIMVPSNDLVSQINECIEDANAFYRVSFDPPAAEHADEYHDVKVQVNKPGATVRTVTGYYNQPATH